MEVSTLFSTPVWSKILSEDFSALLKKIIEKKFDQTGALISNKGGYQSNNIRYIKDEDLQNFISVLNRNLQSVIEQCEILGNRKFEIGNCWVNINEKGNSNDQHYHPNSFLTGVFYFEIENDSGDLVLLRPDLMKHYTNIMSNNENLFQLIKVKPKKNSLIIFPSWLEHKVEPNNTNKPRISFAFNVKEINDLNL